MSLTTEGSIGPELQPAAEDAIPVLSTFRRQVRATLDRDDPSSFWRCRPALEELLHTDFLAPLVNHELDLILSDPRHVPPGVSADGQWLLGHIEGCALIVRLIVGTGQGLANRAVSEAEHAMIGLVSGAPLPCNVFVQSRPHPNDVFDSSRALERPRSMTLRDGEVGCFAAGADVVQLAPGPGNTSVVLKFLSEPVVPLLWEYDLNTRRPIRALSGSATSSRLEYVSALLGAMDSCSAIPALTWAARRHEHHFVRWAAIRSVAFLDPDAGERLLSEAEDDPHPQVRRAAQRALVMARSDDQ